MPAKPKDDRTQPQAEAKTKLTRLLETENALDAMLKETRRQAQELIEAARVAADARVRQHERELETEDRELQKRVARDQERTIASIREEARQETQRLDGLDDDKLTELALHVLGLVLGGPDSGGAR